MKKALFFALLPSIILLAISPSQLCAASESGSPGDAVGAVLGGINFDEAMGKLDRARLRGIESVYLVIENTDSVAGALGISHTLIRRDVEIQLRRAGIKVVQKGESMFYVNVGVLRPLNRIYATNVDVELRDMVSLMRDPKIRFQTTIWSRSILGASGESRAKEGVREDVSNLVDEFILEYLKAKQD